MLLSVTSILDNWLEEKKQWLHDRFLKTIYNSHFNYYSIHSTMWNIGHATSSIVGWILITDNKIAVTLNDTTILEPKACFIEDPEVLSWLECRLEEVFYFNLNQNSKGKCF